LFFVNYFLTTNAYLYSSQWSTINHILSNKDKYSEQQIQKVNRIIYCNYEQWALYKAVQFKQFHKYKCRTIFNDELKLYASNGLNKAITKYDPIKCKNTNFVLYASKYVLGELYLGLTELQPLTIVKKSERRNGIKNRKTNQTIHLSLTPKLLGEEDEFYDFIQSKQYDDSQYSYPCNNNYKKYDELWSKIDSMSIPNFTKKILRLKLSYEFNKIRSNKQVSVLMGCSEEWVRHHLAVFKNNFVIPS